MRGKREAISCFSSTVLLIRMTPPLSTVRTSGSFLALGGGGGVFSSCSLGTFSQNVLVIIGVMTIKMIKSTSTMSTSGVTFTFGRGAPFPSPPTLNAMLLLALLLGSAAALLFDLDAD